MKSRLFLGNFDFEHRLASPSHELPAPIKRLNAELASSWLALAEEGDFIWTPQSIDQQFFLDATAAGLPPVRAVTDLADVPTNVECVPWGWSTDVRQLAERYGWRTTAPALAAVLHANSRATSAELEQRWAVGLPGATRIETLAELHDAIRRLLPSADRWVVKAEFGMSGRERILGNGAAKPADENWVRRRLASNGAVFFEPWVNRIDEVGIQIDVPRDGSPRLLGVAPMLVDHRGQYAGSCFRCDDSAQRSDAKLWQEAVSTALRAATELQSHGYFGPLGIDAMLYLTANGTRQIRPLQDINARWTMGRLSLGWQRLLQPGESGVWQWGEAADLRPIANKRIVRSLKTTPAQVGGTLCGLKSRLLIFDREQMSTDIGRID